MGQVDITTIFFLLTARAVATCGVAKWGEGGGGIQWHVPSQKSYTAPDVHTKWDLGFLKIIMDSSQPKPVRHIISSYTRTNYTVHWISSYRVNQQLYVGLQAWRFLVFKSYPNLDAAEILPIGWYVLQLEMSSDVTDAQVM